MTRQDISEEFVARQGQATPGLAPVELPPLESGDRLSRCEFERRYQSLPDVKKAELVEGVVYMPSPVRAKSHGGPHAQIMTWLGVYSAATPSVQLYDNATVRLDLDNEPQPDALLRLEPEKGGHSSISADDYIEGAPELIVEIAASSASYDLHDKLQVYRRNGVQEYLVWQVYDERINWFRWTENGYTSLAADASGVISSQIFPGLRMAVEALLQGDMGQVLAGLQKGLGTAEHIVFIEQLRGNQ